MARKLLLPILVFVIFIFPKSVSAQDPWPPPVDSPENPGEGYGVDHSAWGEPRHTGIDYLSAFGTAVIEKVGGVVVVAQGGWMGYPGFDVLIRHGTDQSGNQICSLAAHMSAMYVAVGDYVPSGTKIGLTGTAGSGDHFHWGIANTCDFSRQYIHADTDGHGWLDPKLVFLVPVQTGQQEPTPIPVVSEPQTVSIALNPEPVPKSGIFSWQPVGQVSAAEPGVGELTARQTMPRHRVIAIVLVGVAVIILLVSAASSLLHPKKGGKP